jgi:superfamily II DNA or RNA helicase
VRLRDWQKECADHAMQRFELSSHYFCQATPAAGKTILAAEIASRLLGKQNIDLVVCFAPSCQVVNAVQRTFEKVLGRSFDGRIGAAGVAVTYQSLDHQGASFWRLFDQYRVFAVFDEIHHCSAGSDALIPNSWGQRVVQEIQDRATYTLALSGTPWRSDEQAIALARYSDPDGRLMVDYQYSMRRAVSEQVCRRPEITLVDHDLVRLVESGSEEQKYSSLRHLLRHTDVTYEALVTHEVLNRHLLELGNCQLDAFRSKTPDAAALAVATSIDHAYQLAGYLVELGEDPVIVTTRTADANAEIDRFRHSTQRWIVAVGMISEGTDIPRLQVCCYLSRVRTELYFRQVLGRILRRRAARDYSSSLLMIAETELIKFAKRVDEDLPDELGVLKFQTLGASGVNEPTCGDGGDTAEGNVADIDVSGLDGANVHEEAKSGLAKSADMLHVTFDGMFRHQLLALF